MSKWIVKYLNNNDVSFDEFKIMCRGLFQHFVVLTFDEELKSCTLDCEYKMGRKTLQDKFGTFPFVMLSQPLKGMSKDEEQSFYDLKEKYMLGVKRDCTDIETIEDECVTPPAKKRGKLGGVVRRK